MINNGLNIVNKIDQIFEQVTSNLIKADKNLPRSEFKSNEKDYWDDRLTILIKEKIFFYQKWKDQGRPRSPTNTYYMQYKASKSKFMKYLRYLSKEQQEIIEVIKSTELDYKFFWRALKKTRKNKMASVFSIKNKDGLVKYGIEGVLQVWYDHFNELSTPKDKIEFDEDHYISTYSWAKEKVTLNDLDDFLEEDFDLVEIKDAIGKLKKAKSPGFDNICTEHLQWGGENLVYRLCTLFNLCIKKDMFLYACDEAFKYPFLKERMRAVWIPIIIGE